MDKHASHVTTARGALWAWYKTRGFSIADTVYGGLSTSSVLFRVKYTRTGAMIAVESGTILPLADSTTNQPIPSLGEVREYIIYFVFNYKV